MLVFLVGSVLVCVLIPYALSRVRGVLKASSPTPRHGFSSRATGHGTPHIREGLYAYFSCSHTAAERLELPILACVDEVAAKHTALITLKPTTALLASSV